MLLTNEHAMRSFANYVPKRIYVLQLYKVTRFEPKYAVRAVEINFVLAASCKLLFQNFVLVFVQDQILRVGEI